MCLGFLKIKKTCICLVKDFSESLENIPCLGYRLMSYENQVTLRKINDVMDLEFWKWEPGFDLFRCDFGKFRQLHHVFVMRIQFRATQLFHVKLLTLLS